MKPDYDELIQREIDGDLSPEEQTELLAATDTDPRARAEREQMLALAEDLRLLAWCEPAADLPDRVMEEIGRHTASGPRRASGAKPRAGWKPARREILAFAAGVVLMFATARMIPWPAAPEIDERQATGTMMQTDRGEIDRGTLEVDGVRAEAWTERDAERLVLRARGTRESAIPLRIEWENRSWSLASFRGTGAGDLEASGGLARLVPGEPGSFSLELELQLRRPDAPTGEVRLRIEAPGGQTESLNLGTARHQAGS